MMMHRKMPVLAVLLSAAAITFAAPLPRAAASPDVTPNANTRTSAATTPASRPSTRPSARTAARPVRPSTNPAPSASVSQADDGKPKKFLPATKEEAQTEIENTRKAAAAIAAHFKFEFVTLETPHFLLFTDWDPREYDFLKSNIEAAYSVVSRQFDIPVSDNVFIGKLPVFMFASRDNFARFSHDVDEFDVPKNVAGYYRGNSNGFGHMLMWKPSREMAGGDIKAAETAWAYTLTHEFTHAFVARYRTNAFIPRWLNEGLAEVIASRQFPRPGVHGFVRRMAANGDSIQHLFRSDEGLLPAADYALAQTVVETMIVGDPRAFLKFFNDIKDGDEIPDALKKNYHVDYAGLEIAWHNFLKTAK